MSMVAASLLGPVRRSRYRVGSCPCDAGHARPVPARSRPAVDWGLVAVAPMVERPLSAGVEQKET